jgi:hypothetical protein
MSNDLAAANSAFIYEVLKNMKIFMGNKFIEPRNSLVILFHKIHPKYAPADGPRYKGRHAGISHTSADMYTVVTQITLSSVKYSAQDFTQDSTKYYPQTRCSVH